MTYPTKEEIETTRKGLRDLRKRMKGNPELARQILESLDERPLATQPALTPKERSERLLNGINGDDEG